jgi:lipopolysaccharide assembly protein A
MRLLLGLFQAILFILLLGFAIKNMDGVSVRYFLGLEWQAPLVFLLLVFFGIGIASGVLASVSVIMKQRREILNLKRELRNAPRSASPLPAR